MNTFTPEHVIQRKVIFPFWEGVNIANFYSGGHEPVTLFWPLSSLDQSSHEERSGRREQGFKMNVRTVKMM